MVINLLPPKFKKEKEIRRTIKTVSVFLVAIYLIVLILTAGIITADLTTKKDLSNVKEKIADQSKILSRYKEIEDNIKTVNAKISRINSTNSNRILWSSLIIELSKCTPEKVLIKSMVLDQKMNKVDLTGYAETRSDIAKFKEKMSSSKYFKNVTFSSSTHDEANSNYSFNISSELGDTK